MPICPNEVSLLLFYVKCQISGKVQGKGMNVIFFIVTQVPKVAWAACNDLTITLLPFDNENNII